MNEGGMLRYDDYSAAARRVASPPRQSSRASSMGRPLNTSVNDFSPSIRPTSDSTLKLFIKR